MKARLNVQAARNTIRRRLHAGEDKTRAIGNAAIALVHQRFDTGGSSGGAAWPPAKTPDGDSPPLAGLRDTFQVLPDDGSVNIESVGHHAATHQTGATIKPRNATRLFVPLTQKARDAYSARQQAAPTVRRVYAGSATLEKPQTPRDSLAYGVDYVLAKSVTIPSRPMLPTSDAEREKMARMVMKILAGPPAEPHVIQAATEELASLFGIEIER